MLLSEAKNQAPELQIFYFATHYNPSRSGLLLFQILYLPKKTQKSWRKFKIGSFPLGGKGMTYGLLSSSSNSVSLWTAQVRSSSRLFAEPCLFPGLCLLSHCSTQLSPGSMVQGLWEAGGLPQRPHTTHSSLAGWVLRIRRIVELIRSWNFSHYPFHY